MVKGDNLNSTASSVATFLDDGRSMQSYSNPMMLSESKQQYEGSGYGLVGSNFMKSPMYSDGKVYSSLG